MATQYPLTLVAIAAGVLFGILRLPKQPPETRVERDVVGGLRFLAASTWPIGLVLVLVLALHIPMVAALAATVLAVVLVCRVKWARFRTLLWKSLSWRTALVLISVMIFKEVLEASGAVEGIPGAFENLGVPPALLVVLAPFAVGILTGVNQAYVGVAFPMLVPLMGASNPNLSLVMLAYVSGFVGVLLSPVHLCLLLTKNYFGAHYPSVYRLLIQAAIMVELGALTLLAVHVYL